MRKLWDRLRGSGGTPDTGLPPSGRTLLPDVTAAVSAAVAVERIAAVLAPYDAAARLVWLSAGERITAAGLSDLWESRWLLPTGRAVVTANLGIDPRTSDPNVDWEQRYLVLRSAPDLAADPSAVAAVRAGRVPEPLQGSPLGGVIAGLSAAKELPPDWLEQQWAAELRRQPELPRSFYDSPAAVAAFTAQGVDFVAGDGHTFLEATTLPDLGPVWWTRAWDVEYHTPFGRAAG